MLGAARAALLGAGAGGVDLVPTTWTNGGATYYSLSDSDKTVTRDANGVYWAPPTYITDGWSSGIRSIDLKLTVLAGTQRLQFGLVASSFIGSGGTEMSGSSASYYGQQITGRSVNDIITLEHNADTGESKWFVNGSLLTSGTSSISGVRYFFFQEYEVTKAVQISDLVYDPTIGNTKLVR